MVKMSDLPESNIAQPTLRWVSRESTLVKALRMVINMVTNVLMSLTIFVTLIYSCSSQKVTDFHLHIILCVLGYQLFMSQGILVLSKYNSWSMYLTRVQIKHLHVALQIIGFAIIIAGSYIKMRHEYSHFNSVHGSLGVVSLIITTVSVTNGVAARYAYKINKYVFMIKFTHYVCGVLTLLLSAGALTTGFSEVPFKTWMNNDNAVTGLIFISWMFTVLVAVDFWLLTEQRIHNIACNES